MRVCAKKTVTAFDARKSLKPASSIWTNGDHIYSYSTCLVVRLDDGRIVLNRTRYSVTTTIHQNALAAHFRGCLTVDGMRFGACASELKEAALTIA